MKNNKIPSAEIRSSGRTRQRILEAAARIISRIGVTAITLEAVAKEAHVSKGGLLYHFPGKDALMRGMIDYMMRDFSCSLERIIASDRREKGRWTRAYAKVTFAQCDYNFNLNAAFLSAIATNPEMLKFIARAMRILHRRINMDKLEPIAATIVRLAVDGIYFNELYGTRLPDSMRKKVFARLLAMANEAER